MSRLHDVESILQTLATSVKDSEAFSTFESDSNSEHNVHSKYRSSHDTLDESEEDRSEHTPTSESQTTTPTPTPSAHEEKPEQQ